MEAGDDQIAATSPVTKNQWLAWYVANDKQLNDEQTLALFEALFVESSFHDWMNPAVPSSANYPNDGIPPTGGDLDSVGVLQQRVKRDGSSRGWGSVAEAMDPEHAINEFAQRALGAHGSTAGRLAQAVQHSAYPARYDQQEQQASDLIARMSQGCLKGN